MTWGRHVTHMEKCIHVVGRKTWRTKHFEEGNVDGRIILKWILKGWECRQD
jgi:hypothetical protein